MKLKILVVVCLAVSVVTLVDCKEEKKKNRKAARLCGDVRCKAGRRCATRYDGEKTCVCREACNSNQHLICGSDGKTYTNYCHLHRSACLEDKHVSVLHQGPCLIEFEEVQKEVERKSAGVTRPLVCYQVQRDELRQLLVDWLKTKVTKDQSYFDIVHDTFSECDDDKDGNLDGDELLKCTEKKPAQLDSNLHILRGLCMDALINMGDDDDNWVLNEEEFTKILSLHFTPPTRECQLESKNYKDGAETKLDCNLCVCACGNWVCTGAPCYRGKEMGVPGPVVEGSLPNKEETEELLKGFQAVNKVRLSDVEDEMKDNEIKDEIVEELKNMENHHQHKDANM